jgi:hypothetical protein
MTPAERAREWLRLRAEEAWKRIEEGAARGDPRAIALLRVRDGLPQEIVPERAEPVGHVVKGTSAAARAVPREPGEEG